MSNASSTQRSVIGACVDALLGRNIAHYPYSNSTTIAADESLRDIGKELEKVSLPDNEAAEKYLDCARASLAEVKGLTEYQDQKISRLLTIIAFLTAAAGVVFSKFIDLYPPSDLIKSFSIPVAITYILFLGYVLLITFGALIAFHATQTRFVWENPTGDTARDEKAKSFLFFRSIVSSKPEYWARSFLSDDKQLLPPHELQTKYFKNYVAETYLIAAKVGDKVRYLEPAQWLLSSAVRVLIALMVLLAITVISVPQNAKAGAADAKPNGASMGAPTGAPTGAPVGNSSADHGPQTFANNITVNCPTAAVPRPTGIRVVTPCPVQSSQDSRNEKNEGRGHCCPS